MKVLNNAAGMNFGLVGKNIRRYLTTTALTATGVLALASPALADNWTDLENIGGSFDTDISIPDTTNITQHSDIAKARGDLDISENHTVNIFQNGSNSLFAVWDVESDPTYILGKLNANGRVLVVDNNGVFFGQNSVVDVGSIIVTTGNIAADSISENAALSISNDGNTGTITLNGSVSVAEAGLAAFVSPTVQNNGVINAKLGTVALAAGEEVTVDLYGDGLVNIVGGDALSDALIENKGVINAEAGTVIMTADAASDVVNDVINVEGIVDVSSVSQKGGKIVLSGGNKGKVNVSGSLNASGATGGDIEVTGQFVSADGNAVLDASGKGDAGTIHFGGDWQGQGDTPTSEYAFVGQNAILRANSEEDGDGGEVVVWSDLGTGVYGNIEAKGGSLSGNGGNVEVSSLGFYDFRGTVNTTAANGETGNFLLDPLVVRIIGGKGDGHDSGGAAGAGTSGGWNNMGDNAGGFLAYTTASSDASNPYDIYESEIEAVGATTNITIQARQSILTQTGPTSGGNALDNNVTLGANNNLTIQTRNNAGDGDGVIDLSNLAFTTSGTGTITVQGSTGTGVSNITLGNLTSQTGAISVSTDNGNITLGSNGTNGTPNPGGSDGVNGKDSVVKTTTGNINLTANGTIFLGGNGGNGASGNNDGGNGGKGVLLTDTGIINLVSNDLRISGTAGTGNNGGKAGLGLINAQDSTVNIGRYSVGTIDVGDANGSSFRIDQNEIYKIFAANLTIGNANTTNVTVDNVDLYSQLSISEDTDTLPAPSQGCENSGGGNPHCGSNNTLMMNSANLTLKASQFVDIIGEGLTMGTGWVTVDAPRLDLDGRVFAKNTVNGASFLLGDSRLIGTQQLILINVLSPNARIQQAIDFADSTAHKLINVAAGTYTENLLINKGDLKLDGNSATLQAASAGNALITVTASDVNIDPFVFNGLNLVNYGVSASGAGADGLVVDGNTFRNFIVGGVYVDNTLGGTSTIMNNFFEGTSKRGVVLGNLSGGSIVLVNNNDMGLVGGSVINGVQANGTINNATVAVQSGNSIISSGDGVVFNGAISNGSVVQVSGNSIDAGGHGVNFVANQTGSNVIVNGNSLIKSLFDSVHFGGNISGGFVQVSSNQDGVLNSGLNADDHGIYFGGTVNGGAVLNIHDNIINANLDQALIGSGVFFDGAISNATINIGDGDGATEDSNPSNVITIALNNLLAGSPENLDGIHFDKTVGQDADIKIDGNRFGYTGIPGGNVTASGYIANDGIEFKGNVSGNADIDIVDNYIRSNEQGIAFRGSVSGSSNILIGGSGDGNTILGNGGSVGNGILFNGAVSGQSLVEISYNTVTADEDGVLFNSTTSNNVGGNDNEILIRNNSITGGENGIAFNGEASNALHDIVIRDNSLIRGNDGHGIVHSGNINDAELWIRDNGDVFGSSDGIHLEGLFYNNAKILVDGNTVDSGSGDGIDINDTGSAAGSDVDVTDNHVHYTGDNGIEISDIDGVNVSYNTIHDTNGSGIVVDPSDYVDIAHNTITDVGGDGILLIEGDYGQIWDNTITNAAFDGIDVDDNDNVEIWDNDIDESGDNGIEVSDSFNAWIATNEIDDSDGDGIELTDSNNADIRWNDVTDSGDDGIDVHSSNDVDIVGNDIDDADFNGIEVTDSNYVDITWNDITGAGLDGINVENGIFADIENNDIFGTNGGFLVSGQNGANRDGIHVVNNFGVDILNNTIRGGNGGFFSFGGRGAGDDAIFVWGSDWADIRGNNIVAGSSWLFGIGGLGAGDDGIDVRSSFAVDIVSNDINGVAGDGIQVRNSHFADIINNDVTWAGDDGIDVEGGIGVDIINNDVDFVWNNGIEASGTWNVEIRGNDVGLVGFVGDNGIDVRNSNGVLIEDNDVGAFVQEDGIYVNPSSNVHILANRIDGVGENGIHLNGNTDVEVAYNIISNSGARGLYASGQNNGDIVLVGNVFNDNPIGAEFESGIIDLTAPFADRNIFNGGNVGLRFDPGRRGDPSKLVLVNDGNPAFGGTIGETEFNGQTQYYVELLNGAFFAPGFPTILNGWHATYDGFRPDTVPFLSVAQFNAINSKIWDYRDIGSVGLFFFGSLQQDIDDERLFRKFAAFNGDITGLNVRILGLPRLPGQAGGVGANLNSISTFAGGGAKTTIASAADLNNIETAAGGDSSGSQPSGQSSTAEMLNAIETAAGGEGDATTNCWGNAMTTAAGGTAVNVTYSGSFEGNLEQAAACGGAF